MHSPGALGRRRNLAMAIAAVAVLCVGAGVLLASPSGPRYEKRGSVHTVREGNAVYSFDPVWRVEGYRVVDLSTGLEVRPLAPEEARIHRLRGVMLRTLSVKSLDQVPAEGAAEVEAIRALGYI